MRYDGQHRTKYCVCVRVYIMLSTVIHIELDLIQKDVITIQDNPFYVISKKIPHIHQVRKLLTFHLERIP